MLKDTGSRMCDYGKIETMVGPETDAQFQFTGIKKYFNSYTLTSRMDYMHWPHTETQL